MKKISGLLLLLLVTINCFSQYPGYKIKAHTSDSKGYYFVSPLSTPQIDNTQMILDSTGELVYYKVFPGANSFDFKLQPNGLISYAFNNQFFLVDSTFTIVDSVVCQNGISTDFHEMQILPNGHFLMLGEEYVTMDLSGYNYFNHNGSPGSVNAQVLCLVIQELDQNRNVVFEWHSKDYFTFDSVDEFWVNTPGSVDWTHTNALELDYDGNILVSSRNFNEITKVSRTDSSVMWRFGGKHNEFTFIGDTVRFYGQHDIRRLPNGNVTLYDDGNHDIIHAARALEYQLDEVNKTAEVKWSYVYDSQMCAYATGSVQRLANSNTLINYGFINRNNVHFNVVDSTGAKVFELAFNDTLKGYRSFNYLSLPWSFNRPLITCFESGGTSYLDAGAGHSSYQWSDGSTTQTIAVTTADTFSVFVPYGEGGFISSSKFIVTNLSDPCNINSVNETISENDIKLFPNPSHDRITISNLKNTSVLSTVFIRDPRGRIISKQDLKPESNNVSVSLDVSYLETGIYFIRINNRMIKFIKY